MEKPTVLAVHNRYKIAGGEDSVFANEVTLLRENGHKVIEYTRNNNELDSFGKIKKLFALTASVFSFKTYREVKKIIKQEGVDVVHVHNTLTLITPSVYYAARKCRVPVVQTLHNLRFACPSGIMLRDGKICEECKVGCYKYAVKNSCYRKSKLQTLVLACVMKLHIIRGIYKKISYIALTDFNREKLLSKDEKGRMFSPERIFVKPNFVKRSIQPISYAERKPQVIYAGRLDSFKGIDVMLEAWRGISDLELKIFGDGEMLKFAEDFISENGLTNVKLMGKAPTSEVMAELSHSAALILPTQVYEGFPVSIAEAMSVGTPSLVSDIGNPAVIVKDGVNGFKFDRHSPESIRTAVARLGECDMTESTYKLYTEKYDDTANYKALSKIYSEVLKK